MRLRVTNAVTKNGRYYAAGETLDTPTATEQSLGRLFKWEKLADSAPSLAGKRKPELVQIAEGRGLDVDGLTKPELVDLLTE